MTTDTRPTPWGHASHRGAEEYEGTFPNREAAIADAAANHEPSPDVSFVVAEGHWIDATEAMPDALRIVEMVEEYVGDEWCEGIELDPISNEAGAELDALLKGWAEKYLKCDAWQADRLEEYNICATCKAVGLHDDMPDENAAGDRICDACVTIELAAVKA